MVCKKEIALPKKIVAKLAVLEVTSQGFKLPERALGVTVAHIIASTATNLIIEGELFEMIIG